MIVEVNSRSNIGNHQEQLFDIRNGGIQMNRLGNMQLDQGPHNQPLLEAHCDKHKLDTYIN